MPVRKHPGQVIDNAVVPSLRELIKGKLGMSRAEVGAAYTENKSLATLIPRLKFPSCITPLSLLSKGG